ncbi:MAG: TniB family NTP-binding protein [Pyrinomonadaceae bacterium]
MKRKIKPRKDQKQNDRNVRFGKLSKAERLVLIEKVFVRYPRLKKLNAKIDFCRDFSKISAEPECMLITGTKGAGKTTLIDWYASGFPVRESMEKRIIPVLVVTVPSPATVKGLGSAMLDAIGDPAADKGAVSSITLRMRKYIKDCEVELIILDEFQHFDDRQSKNVLKTISDWLKNVINETHRPIVLVGMPGCESVLENKGNDQLKRRFSSREEIVPFAWDTKAHVFEFRQLLKEIDAALPLLEDSHLADQETAFLIYSATDGVINYVMKLLRWAAKLAIESGTEQIDNSILADAYEKRLAQDFPKRPNPFNPLAGAHQRRAPATRANLDRGATNKRVKPRERKQSMSEVLKHR